MGWGLLLTDNRRGSLKVESEAREYKVKLMLLLNWDRIELGHLSARHRVVAAAQFADTCMFLKGVGA